MDLIKKHIILTIMITIAISGYAAEIDYEKIKIPERKAESIIVSIDSQALLFPKAYNFLFAIEFQQINTTEKFFTRPFGFWIRYSRGKPVESVVDNRRKLYGMYEMWSYLSDDATYPAFNDVTMNVLFLGYNYAAGINMRVFDNSNLLVLFKYGGGYDIEWFDGKVLDSDFSEILGTSEGAFFYLGIEMFLDSFYMFEKYWYTKLGYDLIYKGHQVSDVFISAVKFGIGMEL